MKKSGLTSNVSGIFKNDNEVTAVYLFGSCATGNIPSNSDIDLPILFNNHLSKLEAHERLEKYFVELAKGLRAEPDPLDMEQLNLILWYEILRDDGMTLSSPRPFAMGD